MKQNAIIVLLTAVLILLAVNLLGGRLPSEANAAAKKAPKKLTWQIACQTTECFVLRSDGGFFYVGNFLSRLRETYKSCIRIAEKYKDDLKKREQFRESCIQAPLAPDLTLQQ